MLSYKSFSSRVGSPPAPPTGTSEPPAHPARPALRAPSSPGAHHRARPSEASREVVAGGGRRAWRGRAKRAGWGWAWGAEGQSEPFRGSHIRGLLLLAAVAACSPRTLTLVDLYSDGGLPPASLDGNPAAASDTANPAASDATNPAAFDAANPASLLRGLVGLWHFDDPVGSTVARDSSGNGNDGTLVGLDPALAWVTGRQGGALAPSGLGYVSVADSASIDSITTEVTLSAWVYFDGVIPVDYGTALSRQIRSTNEQYYHLSLYQDGTPTLFIGFSASIAAARPTAPQPVVSRHWTHMAGTYDGSLATLYVDGVVAGSRPIVGVFPRDATPLILSGNGNAGAVSEFFPGRLDEIALYNRALSPDEIKLLATPVAF